MTASHPNRPLIHQVISDLLRVADEDTTPDGHTSSHWKYHSDQIVVGGKGEDLILEGSGFGEMYARRRSLHSICKRLERSPIAR